MRFRSWRVWRLNTCTEPTEKNSCAGNIRGSVVQERGQKAQAAWTLVSEQHIARVTVPLYWVNLFVYKVLDSVTVTKSNSAAAKLCPADKMKSLLRVVFWVI